MFVKIGHTVKNMKKRSDRAKQFMPFDALKGYGELIRETENFKEEKRELSEFDAKELNEKIMRLEKSVAVKAVFYDGNGYKEIRGETEKVDFVFRWFSLCGKKIFFDDFSELDFL